MKRIDYRKLKQKKKDRKFFWHYLLASIYIIGSFVMLLWGIQMYYIGFHNLDLIHNYQNLALQANVHLLKYNVTFNNIDITSDQMLSGDVRTLRDIYASSNLMTVQSLKLMLAAGLAFMLGLWTLDNTYREYLA